MIRNLFRRKLRSNQPINQINGLSSTAKRQQEVLDQLTRVAQQRLRQTVDDDGLSERLLRQNQDLLNRSR